MGDFHTTVQVISWLFLLLFLVCLILRLVNAHKQFNYTGLQILYVSADFSLIFSVAFIWLSISSNRINYAWFSILSLVIACLAIVYVGLIKKQAVKLIIPVAGTLGVLSRGISGRPAQKEALLKLCAYLFLIGIIMYHVLALGK